MTARLSTTDRPSMKPVAIFASIVAVGLLAIGVVYRATNHTASATPLPAGAPSTKPTSAAQFQHAGVQLCLSLRAQLIWLQNNKPKKLRQVPGYVARATSAFDELTTKILAMDPPSSVPASWVRLRQNLPRADRVLHHLNHLTATRQWRLTYLFVHSREWKNAFKRFGGHAVKPQNMRCDRATFTA